MNIKATPIHRLRPLKPRAVLVTGLCAVLTSCSSMVKQLENVGKPPPITDIENPTQQPGYKPVSMPMPAIASAERTPNSLWQPGARSFFKDQRAHKIGDLVTVKININDNATTSNITERKRTAVESTR